MYDYNTQTLINYVLYRSVAIGRTFQLQSRAWNPVWTSPHVMQCGIAVREENDLIIIDECVTGTPQLISRITSPSNLAPTVKVSNNVYEVNDFSFI